MSTKLTTVSVIMQCRKQDPNAAVFVIMQCRKQDPNAAVFIK